MSEALNPILQQGIDNLQRHNTQANADLTETLQDMREKLQAPYVPPLPSAGGNPVNPQDDLHYKRIVLYGSQWASEVIAAAALDEDFKTETAERAKTVLRANGMLPADPPETPATDT